MLTLGAITRSPTMTSAVASQQAQQHQRVQPDSSATAHTAAPSSRRQAAPPIASQQQSQHPDGPSNMGNGTNSANMSSRAPATNGLRNFGTGSTRTSHSMVFTHNNGVNSRSDSNASTGPAAVDDAGNQSEASIGPSTRTKKNLAIITSYDDSDHDRPRRPSRAPLLRSQSEHMVRHEEPDFTDDEIHEWGARHGFDDHYQSEDIISQLANVSTHAIICPSAVSRLPSRGALSHSSPGSHPGSVPPPLSQALLLTKQLLKFDLSRIGTCISQINDTRQLDNRSCRAMRSRIGECEIA